MTPLAPLAARRPTPAMDCPPPAPRPSLPAPRWPLAARRSPLTAPRSPLTLLLLALLLFPRLVADRASNQAAADAFFDGPILLWKLRIPPASMAKLRSEPRTYAEAEVEVGGATYRGVGVHLKGSAGSKRSIDDHPALTLDFNRFSKGQRVFGLSKLHLNNSVQDPSLINDNLASRTYRAAGIPATRATHAFVDLNGEALGIYVVKEAYDDDYLRRHFPEDKGRHGNLYDGGFVSDITRNLERDGGNGPSDHSDLVALREATSTPLHQRTNALAKVLDVERFRSLVAIQFALDDWDGYVRNRNNYRIYFRPDGRAVFLPSGMDQLLRNAEAPVRDGAMGRVAAALLAIPAERIRLRDHMRQLSSNSNLLSSSALLTVHDAIEKRIDDGLAALPAAERARFHGPSRDRSFQIRRRMDVVQRDLAEWPDPVPPWPKGKVLNLAQAAWTPYDQTGQAQTVTNASENGRRLFQITVQKRVTRATIRATVPLPGGRFRLSGMARCEGVEPLSDDLGRGVGIRITGSTGTQHLEGTAPWTRLSFDFEQPEDGPVELLVEVKGHAGTAWFDVSTLQVEAL